jgi:UDP-2,3-diacylglucosamine pyrophosphatase LpxH
MPRVRSILLSDIHLGTRGCQAERLLEFLKEYESDFLFLIGDIVNFWAMSRAIYPLVRFPEYGRTEAPAAGAPWHQGFSDSGQS